MGQGNGWCSSSTWRRSSRNSMRSGGRRFVRGLSSSSIMPASTSRNASGISLRNESYSRSPSLSILRSITPLSGCSLLPRTSSKETTSRIGFLSTWLSSIWRSWMNDSSFDESRITSSKSLADRCLSNRSIGLFGWPKTRLLIDLSSRKEEHQNDFASSI